MALPSRRPQTPKIKYHLLLGVTHPKACGEASGARMCVFCLFFLSYRLTDVRTITFESVARRAVGLRFVKGAIVTPLTGFFLII